MSPEVSLKNQKKAQNKPLRFITLENGCQVCISHVKCDTGYIQYGIKDKLLLLHRVVYETCFGPIPEGYEVHHICETRPCCNPKHLTAMPSSVHKALSMVLRHAPTKEAARRVWEELESKNYRHLQAKTGLSLSCAYKYSREFSNGL